MGRRVPGLQLPWAMECLGNGGRALLGALSLLEVTEEASKATVGDRIWAEVTARGLQEGHAQSREDFPPELKVKNVA